MPTPQTHAAMAAAPHRGVVTSYIQEDHLRSGTTIEGSIKRLAITTFKVHDVFDADALTATFTAYLRSHSSFHTVFDKSGDTYTSRTLLPEEIELAVVATGTADSAQTAKDYLLETIPSIDEWASFGFAVTGIENAGPDAENPSFTVVAIADHLFTDGVSQAISLFDLLNRYRGARSGIAEAALPGRPYHEYAASQRARTATLDAAHPEVTQWRDTIQRNGGMPSFPLSLGLRPGESALGELMNHASFADRLTTEAFAQAAKRAGGSISCALLAVLAEAEREFRGSDTFTIMSPRSDRTHPDDMMSIGWFVTLVPIQFDTSGSFDELVRAADAAQRKSKLLQNLPVFPVIDLLADDPRFPVRHGFAAPMLSYLDLSRLPCADLADLHEFEVYGNPTPSREVFMWINRDASGLDFNAMHPATDIARANVKHYFEFLRTRIHEVVAQAEASELQAS